MRDVVVGLVVFACLLAASLGSRALYERIPERHRVAETESVIRLFASFFVVFLVEAINAHTILNKTVMGKRKSSAFSYQFSVKAKN